MMLRRRQREFTDKCGVMLKERKNTLGIAPTGAGKTIMMAAVALENAPKELPSLVIQHRDELVTQNRNKFIQYAGIRNIRRPMTIDADSKAWDRSAAGWNFAMVQTLIQNLDSMPKLGLLAIDEAHHAAADSYLQIISRAKSLNPDILIYGTTATPNRGDRKALRTVFDNCGDQIQIGELIREGHLVRPRTFVVRTGSEEAIAGITSTGSTADKEIAKILNIPAITDRAIQIWMHGDPENGVPACGHRQTIVFCSSADHAKDVTQRFCEHGIKAEFIGDSTGKKLRREILARYESGDTQVLVNVYILTEGFDHQPTSCVVLLKRESFKSTMVQMIGRGLRKVDPELYPGIIKDDCIVLDYGTSCITHGSLEDEPDLNGRGVKMCPDCQSTVPQSSKECAICGHEFPVLPTAPSAGGGGSSQGVAGNEGALSNFVMSEIDIMQDSPFKYEGFYQGRVMLCFGFNCWAAVVHYQDNRFYAIGAEAVDPEKPNDYKLHILNSSDQYLIALQSADDYMRTNGSKSEARKVAQWLYEPPTAKQLDILMKGSTLDLVTEAAQNVGMSKYRACCGIKFKFYKGQIRGAIQGFIDATTENEKRYA